MHNFEHIKKKLTAAGHQGELVDRTAKTAQALRSILESQPEPSEHDLKTVFEKHQKPNGDRS